MNEPKTLSELTEPIFKRFDEYCNTPEHTRERLAYLLGQSATLNQLRLKITDELIAVQKGIRNLEAKGK